MTAEVTIYAPAISTFARITAITADEKGLSWMIVPTPTDSPEQASRHPFRKAPAVELGDEKLFETDAITRYIDEAYTGPSLQPAEPRSRAEMQKWISVMQHYFFPTTEIGLVSPRLLAPAQGVAVDEAMVQRVLPSIRYQLALIDAQLSVNTFFAGATLSLADFYNQVCWWAVFLTPEGREMIARSESVIRWLGFMMHRPSAARTAWPDDEAALAYLDSL